MSDSLVIFKEKSCLEYSNGEISAVRADFNFYMSSFEFYWVKICVGIRIGRHFEQFSQIGLYV